MQLTLRINGDDALAILDSLQVVADDIRRANTHSGQTSLAMAKRGWFAHWKFDFPEAKPSVAAAASSVVPQKPLVGAAFNK